MIRLSWSVALSNTCALGGQPNANPERADGATVALTAYRNAVVRDRLLLADQRQSLQAPPDASCWAYPPGLSRKAAESLGELKVVEPCVTEPRFEGRANENVRIPHRQQPISAERQVPDLV